MQEFSVKEISQILSGLLKNAFPELVAVTGEISQISSQNSSGHIYFTLKEGDAVLNATYFKYYHAANKCVPKLGDKVKVIGEIKSYDRTSSYQINVRKIEYDSEGLLWKQFEEMKKKLMAEGLFDESRKRPVPKYPYRVAVLTALSGAVIRDFIVTTKNEMGRYLIDVWNIPVQNIENAPVIAETINKAGSLVDRYDVIVVMRGGGSMEDLAVFNQEVVARAAAASKVPLISAVGHETDYTIIDFAADYRAATPTAAAAYLSSHYKAAGQLLDKYNFSIKKTYINILQKYEQYVDLLSLKLNNKSPQNNIIKYSHKIDSFDKMIENILNRKIFNFNTKLNRIENIISSANPKNMIITYNVRIVNSRKMLAAGLNKKLTSYNQKEEVLRKNLKNITGNTLEKKHSSIEFLYHKLLLCSPLKNMSGSRYKLENIKKSLLMAVREKYALSNRLYKDINNRFEQYIINYIFNKNAHVSKLESKLILLDPKNVMERGYAIISQKENIISSVENIVLDKEMEIMMKDGTIYAYPEKVVSSEHNETYENTKTEKILK